ncbi:hypothetical protein H489_0109905 [Curtobacterium flaccumfaciens UCD-AKU]|nr:hypothetical protein H489_0109905 [Curtobacterium flaccumfaciens UCD-AKU]
MMISRDGEDVSLEWSTGVAARSIDNTDSHLRDAARLQALLVASEVEVPAPPVIPQSGYHLATADHPFLDMSRGVVARVEDAHIMAGYAASDDYPAVELSLVHDRVVDIEDAADLTLDELRNSDLYRFSAIVSGTFGVRRHQPAYFDPITGYHQVEIVKKSIPSGGSRHPSELFLEVLRSPKMATGTWHYNATRRQLQRISSSTATEEVESSADWVVRTHIVSVVRRAMFRYRDPRSFRAILVDAGHADAQFEAIAKFCNWRYRSSASIDFTFGPTVGLAGDEIPRLVTGTLEGWV